MTQTGTMERVYRFGRFLLEPARRSLSADGAPVMLGSRAYDILQMLVERRDTVVSRDDILSHVWRGTVVEDNTLAVQISALRRVLGEPQVIATVAGRGYRFVGAVLDDAQDTPDAPGGTLARIMPPPAPVLAAPAAAWRGRHRRPAVAAGLLAFLACVLFVARDLVWTPHVAPRLSIVVLPFRNLGHDAEQDYLADAISDDLTTDLSHLPGSVVIARTSADSYKGRAVPTGEIGRALDVRYVLEGSILAENDSLHINAQLIDAPSGAHLWAHAFDVPRDRLSEARSEIVNYIGSALNVMLVNVEGARSLRDRPDNPDAVDLYLRARSVLDHGISLRSMAEAQRLLERAVALAPDFTDGLSKLATVLLHKVSDFDDLGGEMKDHARAVELIDRAIRLAPQDVETLAAKGQLELADRKFEEAAETFRLATTIDANDVEALSGLARCAYQTGHLSELVEDMKHLQRLDPVGRRSAARHAWIGAGYLLEGDAASALVWLKLAGADARAAESDTPLGWQEWRQLHLIAANEEAGFPQHASELYRAFQQTHPRRTAWLLSSYATHALAALPGHKRYEKALVMAGMPEHADEHADFGLPASANPQTGNDFSPTPVSIPGGKTISTQSLRAMIEDQSIRPVIVDAGRGAGVIPGAIWAWSQGWWDEPTHVLSETTTLPDKSQPLVVVGDGPLGWDSYDLALKLISNGYSNVLWYRGGEDAWSAAGLPSQDRRTP